MRTCRGWLQNVKKYFNLHGTIVVLSLLLVLYLLFSMHSSGYASGLEEGRAESWDLGYEAGYDAGREAGYENGASAGYKGGYDDGWDLGYSAGFSEGAEIGYGDGWDDAEDNYAQEYRFFRERSCIVTEEGYRYHHYGCYHIDGRNFWIYNVELAEAKGYSPCLDCWEQGLEDLPLPPLS